MAENRDVYTDINLAADWAEEVLAKISLGANLTDKEIYDCSIALRDVPRPDLNEAYEIGKELTIANTRLKEAVVLLAMAYKALRFPGVYSQVGVRDNIDAYLSKIEVQDG